MPQTLPLTNKISQASAGSTSFKWNEAKFGDGYSQRVPDGINYTKRKWSIVYDNIDVNDFTTIQTFVDTVGDGQYFTWQPPGINTSLKWILDGDVKFSQRSGNIWSVSFGILQVYDLN